MASPLDLLPDELLCRIVTFIKDPRDMMQLARTCCRAAHVLDRHVWRDNLLRAVHASRLVGAEEAGACEAMLDREDVDPRQVIRCVDGGPCLRFVLIKN